MYGAILAGSGSGLVVSWEQETGILLASGDVRFIRVWDTQREMRMQVRLRSVSVSVAQEILSLIVYQEALLVIVYAPLYYPKFI